MASLTTLILGDGDLSYARAVAEAAPAERHTLACTTFDSAEQLAQRYGERARANAARLRELGCDVRHCVDARAIEVSYGTDARWSTIVFNFPHWGGKGKIQKNRQLLADFFASAAAVLAAEGEVRLSLARNQGGTPDEALQPVIAGNSWQCAEQAARSRMVLSDVRPWADPEGYRSTRNRQTVVGTPVLISSEKADNGFYTEDALTHVFVHEARGLPVRHPPRFTHDVSLWVTNEELCGEEILLAWISDGADDLVAEFGGPEIADFLAADGAATLIDQLRITPRDTSVATTKTLSLVIRVHYESATRAMSKKRCRAMQSRLRVRMQERFEGSAVVR